MKYVILNLQLIEHSSEPAIFFASHPPAAEAVVAADTATELAAEPAAAATTATLA